MHKGKRARKITGAGCREKTALMGTLERGANDKTSKIRTTPVSNRKRKAIHAELCKHVEARAALYTDALQSYKGFSEFEHQVIDHAVAHVDGRIHTHGPENFWSLLKRGINGTYVSVEPFHLFRYLDEQACRFNHRKSSDAERFSLAVSRIVGKRVTFDQLISKTGNSSVEFSC